MYEMFVNVGMGLAFLGALVGVLTLPEFIYGWLYDKKWGMPLFYLTCGIIVFCIGASINGNSCPH